MAQLIDAIHILCGENIECEKLQLADQLLHSFVDNFELLYGESQMVFNVHLLKHLANCVRNIGPLFTYSNYHFEDNIGHLVSFHKGTTDVADQICEKYLLEKNMFSHLEKSSMARDFYDEICLKYKYKNVNGIAGSILLGNPNKNPRLSEQDKILIANQLNIQCDFKLNEFSAMILNCKVFYESINKSDKHTSDSFIFNSQNGQFANIESIFIIDNNLHLLINEKFDINFDSSSKCKSSIELNEAVFDRKKVISPECIGPKFAFVKFENSLTCSKFPNMIERN